MSKIICDICGTSYQDTAECCPICGCTKDSAADFLTEEAVTEETVVESANKAVQTASKKAIFDYDEANIQRKKAVVEESADDDEEEDEEEEEPRRNIFVVILLTILIFAMLVAAGFIFVRYFLPNMNKDKEETRPAATEAQQVQQDTTEQRIGCETLVLNSGSQADLAGVGFSHLINVLVVPENTTDTLTFLSADESIATVSEDGKITAVGEGETIVTITCGNVQAYVNVSCDFTPETEPAAEATEATEAEEADETTAATEENKKVDSNVVLKLKKSDIRLGVYYQFTLELDCDLDPKDVQWSSEHPHIAKVDDQGVVTAMQAGTTGIIAQYGDQKVQCIVRCF